MQLQSLRSFTLPTKHGHMIRFESGTPTYVPDEAVQDAMAAGCVPAEGEAPFIDEAAKARVEFNGPLRTSLLTLAIQEIATRNDPSDFTGANLPKAEAVKMLLGFEVYKEEVGDTFRAVMAARSSKEKLMLHKDAQTVYDIVQAETRADLEKYLGKDKTDTTGMSTRELRKHLLRRYSGIAAG